MFESARLKLTAWYVVITMIISMFFSVAFYQSSTSEIQQSIDRIKYVQKQMDYDAYPFPSKALPPFYLEELENVKNRIKIALVILNAIILVFAGGAGYFLAGRSLRPIKLMLDEQNQFISSASHELRTPIATLRAEMEGSLLEKNISDKEARKLIQSNLEELTTLQELTNSLLHLAHVHTVQTENGTELLSLQEVIAAAQKKILPLAKQKHISFTTKIDKVKIVGDKRSLIEAFVILLDNAIKYSPVKSHVTIVAMKSKDSVSISIADEGIGIAKQDIYHIFERFYRADKSRHKEGYGLGLSIAKKIVQTHNGSINVVSRENKGSTFTIILPLHKA